MLWKCGHYIQSYTDAFDTASLSLSAANWPETRVQTVFPAIDLQNSCIIQVPRWATLFRPWPDWNTVPRVIDWRSWELWR